MSDVAYDPLRYQQAGRDSVRQLYGDYASRIAGGQLASGNTRGASQTLYRAGDLAAGQALEQQAVTTDAARREREAKETLQITSALREAQRRGQSVVEALDSYRPQISRMGVDDARFGQLRTLLETNPNALDDIERLAGREAQQWEFKQGPTGDVIGLRNRPDGSYESQVAYNAPDRPISTPYGIILPPQGAQAQGSTPQGAMPSAPPAASSAAGTFESIMPGLLQREGGFTPSDGSSGAPANFGINQAANPDIDVRNIDANRATEIYRERYWRPIEEAGVPPEAREAVFDFGVNAGPQTSLRLWQESGGDLNRFNDRRRQYYRSLPDYSRYGRQWERRVDETSGGSGGVAGQQPAATAAAQDLGGGYTLQQMQTPADQRAEVTLDLARQANERAERTAARLEAGVTTLSPQEVAALGLPEGSVAQREPNGSINVVSRGGTERFTEGMRRSAALAFRMNNAATTLSRLEGQGLTRPSPAVLVLQNGAIRENGLSQTDRQWLQAAREWLAPVLRKDTGAAVSDGELVTYMATYLASPTDDPATLQQKAQARRAAEQALRAEAGGAYDSMFPEAGGRRQTRTNAPGIPFDISQPQLQFRQQLVQSGRANVRAPRGAQDNPIYINPQTEERSLQNIRPGQWFVTPQGERLQMPQTARTRRRR